MFKIDIPVSSCENFRLTCSWTPLKQKFFSIVIKHRIQECLWRISTKYTCRPMFGLIICCNNCSFLYFNSNATSTEHSQMRVQGMMQGRKMPFRWWWLDEIQYIIGTTHYACRPWWELQEYFSGLHPDRIGHPFFLHPGWNKIKPCLECAKGIAFQKGLQDRLALRFAQLHYASTPGTECFVAPVTISLCLLGCFWMPPAILPWTVVL